MNQKTELPKRKTTRLQNHDYSMPGAYFITICTQNRQCILSHIVGTGVLDCPQVKLTAYGEIADKYLKQLSAYYDHISVEHYVIMPNHIHLLLFINTCGQSGTPVPTTEEGKNIEKRFPTVPVNVERSNSVISKFISTFKRFCNKEYGKNIWQPRAHDHIIRDLADYEQHWNYICENPIRWQLDELYADE